MIVPEIPINPTSSYINLSTDGNLSISIQEALKASPKELSGILMDAMDKKTVSPNNAAKFIKAIYRQSPELARSAMKYYSTIANYAPKKRLPLLNQLRETDLYFKPIPVKAEKTLIDRPHDHIVKELTSEIGRETFRDNPQKVSSNGAPLPNNSKEVAELYVNSVPDKYKKYVRLEIFKNNDIPKMNGKYVGRYAPQDKNTELKTEKALLAGVIDVKKYVVFVNSGGAHSIAAARALAKNGYLIIPHFSHGKSKLFEQDTAALLYFAKEIADLNMQTIRKNPDAPWAVISDAHMGEVGDVSQWKQSGLIADNDLPPIPKGYGIIHVNEGDGYHSIDPNDRDIVHDSLRIAAKRGVKDLFVLGLNPYTKAVPFSAKK